MNLTNEQINLLVKGLDAAEVLPVKEETLNMVLQTMMRATRTDFTKEQQREFIAKSDKVLTRLSEEQQVLKRKHVLIRAHLIGLQDELGQSAVEDVLTRIHHTHKEETGVTNDG